MPSMAQEALLFATLRFTAPLQTPSAKPSIRRFHWAFGLRFGHSSCHSSLEACDKDEREASKAEKKTSKQPNMARIGWCQDH